MNFDLLFGRVVSPLSFRCCVFFVTCDVWLCCLVECIRFGGVIKVFFPILCHMCKFVVRVIGFLILCLVDYFRCCLVVVVLSRCCLLGFRGVGCG